jgi:ABC-type uncharacterized transport system permease subunit
MGVIVWRGKGYLSFVILLASAVAIGLLKTLTVAIAAPQSKPDENVVLLFVCLLAAVVNWFVGKRLNGEPARELLDEKTGRKVILKPRHTVWFFNMEYMSVLFVVLGLVSAAKMFGLG